METYLIDRPVERGDFYGKLLRLALVGYIRPELKFDSLLSLVAQIEKDVNISRKVCSTLSNGSAGVGVDSKAVGTDMRELYKCTVLPRLKHTNQRTGNYLFLCDYDTSGTS